jgi:histone deacetylase 6
LLCRFDFGSFYPSQGDASHCFIGEGAGQGYNINVPWEHGKCGDADYVAAWDHVLLPVAEAFDPDIILLSAGFDAGRQAQKFLELSLSLNIYLNLGTSHEA